MHPCAKFQVCSFTRFGDMFEGVPNFIRVRDLYHAPFWENLSLWCPGLPILSSVANIKCLLLFSSFYLSNMHCSVSV